MGRIGRRHNMAFKIVGSGRRGYVVSDASNGIHIRIELCNIVLSPEASKYGHPGNCFILWDADIRRAAIAPNESGDHWLAGRSGNDSLRVYCKPFLRDVIGEQWRGAILPAMWDQAAQRWEFDLPKHRAEPPGKPPGLEGRCIDCDHRLKHSRRWRCPVCAREQNALRRKWRAERKQGERI